MSYSFIIIDLKNECDINEINNSISSNYKNYEILYCNTAEIKGGKNVVSFSFDKNVNSEEVVNSVLRETKKQNIVLIRKFINVEIIKQITDNLDNKNSVVYLSKKKNFAVNLIDKILNKVTSFVFGKKIKNVNHSAVAYGELVSNVIKNINTPSISSRMNNWTGVSEKYVECSEKYKITYSKKRIAFALVPLFVSVSSIIVWFLLKSKFGMRFNLLTAFVVLFGFTFFFIFSNLWYFRANVGENITEKAKYIKIKESKNGKN